MATSTSDPELLGDLVRQLQTQGRLSPRKAAPLLKRHYITVREYISKGWIRTIKIGERHYITQEEVIRFNTEGNWIEPETGAEYVKKTGEEEAATVASFDPSHWD